MHFCSHFISLVLAQDDSYSEIQCNTPVHVVVFNNRLLVAVTNSTNHDVVLSCQSRDCTIAVTVTKVTAVAETRVIHDLAICLLCHRAKSDEYFDDDSLHVCFGMCHF